MLDRNLIGKEVLSRQAEVERGAILRFVEASGDGRPDEVVAGPGGGHARLQAPPAFAMTLGSGERIFEMLQVDPRLILLGEQSIDLACDIHAGDRLRVATSVKDIYERLGTTGMMSFMVIEDEGRSNDGALVFRMRRTFIARTRPERAPPREA